MLRQALKSPSRALSSSLALRVPSLLSSRPQFYAPPAAVQVLSVDPLRRRPARWYSAESQSKPEEAAEASKTGSDAGSTVESSGKAETPSAQQELQKQLEAKDVEVRNWKDKYLRSVADFRNLQDRTQRDAKAARDFAIQVFAKDLVESVDDLGRALNTVSEDKVKGTTTTAAEGEAGSADSPQNDLVNLYEGIRMTEQNLMKTLARHGLTRFDPVGEKFNPNEHEATFMTPVADKDDNMVFHTQQAGFKLNGRIIRAAKVGVVKNN